MSAPFAFLPGIRILAVVVFFLAAIPLPVPAAEPTLPAATRAKVEAIAHDILRGTDVPSLSVAIARDGNVVYTGAFGSARMEPPTPATPAMRYPIGSISKQFTATAVLLLAEDGKLRLDDTVGTYINDLGPASSVTIRQILAHTAGIRDYWPQDYVFSRMLKPTTTREILDGWANQPLDFEPGTRWQYSNTGYVLAGAIVEKVSGKPLFQFLRERVFEPLGMKSVIDVDQGRLGEGDSVGYQRFGIGPARVAPKEGKGWLQAAGQLAMTAEDLAKWELCLAGRGVLGDASRRDLTREVVLRNGAGSQYALGLSVKYASERLAWSHGGEISGFSAHAIVFPELGVAIVALANQDVAGAPEVFTSRVASVLLADSNPDADKTTREARAVLVGLKDGKIDRALLTPNASDYFSEAALRDFKAGLKPLGELEFFAAGRTQTRGGMNTRIYTARFAGKTLQVIVRAMPDGKLEQYTVSAE